MVQYHTGLDLDLRGGNRSGQGSLARVPFAHVAEVAAPPADLREVPARIEDERATDGLTALRRPPTARQYWDAHLPRDLHDSLHVADRSWEDDAERFDLIVRRIGRVEPSREGVEADLALQSLVQTRVEGGIPRSDARFGHCLGVGG